MAENQVFGVDVIADSDYQSELLENLGQARNYRDWLCSLVEPYLGENPLELGCGNGDYAARLLELGLPRITLSEIDLVRLNQVTKRFEGDSRVSFAEVDVSNPLPARHSSMFSFNVLEHIEDDVEALRSARRLVRPGGYVFHFVPAFPIGMSDLDRRVGHFRRYRKRDLLERAEGAGLEVEKIHYVNAPGLLAWIVVMRLLKGEPTPGRMLGFWDRYVIPAARRIESRFHPPFGQSAVLISKTPG